MLNPRVSGVLSSFITKINLFLPCRICQSTYVPDIFQVLVLTESLDWVGSFDFVQCLVRNFEFPVIFFAVFVKLGIFFRFFFSLGG